MADSPISDELWQEFHDVVNMTSRELEEWLRSSTAGERSEEVPEQAGSPTGQQVLQILAKRRADLADEDIEVMERVVELVRSERGEELEPEAGSSHWRHRLMSVGHDPLKPPEASR